MWVQAYVKSRKYETSEKEKENILVSLFEKAIENTSAMEGDNQLLWI